MMGVPRRPPGKANASGLDGFDGVSGRRREGGAGKAAVVQTARAALAPHCPSNLHANITVNVLSTLGRGVIE